ncbi:TPA: spore coat U domain-containing protein [Klebsiella variicola]|nr:spore coat U domain-containing protein [Klebsiella variicola]
MMHFLFCSGLSWGLLPRSVTSLRSAGVGLLLIVGGTGTPEPVLAAISSPACYFTGNQLNLGNYSGSVATDSGHTLGFSCAVGFSWDEADPRATFRLCLYMGEDPGTQAGYLPLRYLKNNNVTGTGQVYLAYNLYADRSHSQVLMPEGTGTPLVVDFTLTGEKGSTYVSGSGSIPVYARIPGGQGALPAGAYYSYNPNFTLRYQAVSGGVPPASCDGGSSTYASGNIQITTEVADSCSLSVVGVNFGTINEIGPLRSEKVAEGRLAVQCSQGKPYTVYLGSGNNPGEGGSRQMANGDARLPYQLYQNAAHTLIWNETGGILQTGGSGGVSLMGSGSEQTLPVYGRIQAGTTVPGTVGAYTDTVTVTVSY